MAVPVNVPELADVAEYGLDELGLLGLCYHQVVRRLQVALRERETCTCGPS